MFERDPIKELCALRGIWPPLKSKLKMAFHPFLPVSLLEECKSLIFISPYTVSIVAKMATKNRLKIQKLPFSTKFEALGDQVLRIRYQLS